MNFVGGDLPQHSISVCTMVQAGTSRSVTARRRFRSEDEEKIPAFVAELGPFEVVVEATASYEWIVRLIESLARRLVKRTCRWSFRYERLMQRCGAKKAIVAVARRLWCVIVAMLKSGPAYRAAAG